MEFVIWLFWTVAAWLNNTHNALGVAFFVPCVLYGAAQVMKALVLASGALDGRKTKSEEAS